MIDDLYRLNPGDHAVAALADRPLGEVDWCLSGFAPIGWFFPSWLARRASSTVDLLEVAAIAAFV
jgi:hypothetical protein